MGKVASAAGTVLGNPVAGVVGLALTMTGCYGGLTDAGSAGAMGGATDGASGETDGESGDPPPELTCEDGTPGPRTLRLLTRREYRNTIVDLLGVAAPDIDVVPLEPRIDGYDNNAAASLVTARHVEAYVEIAQLVADEAMAQDVASLAGCMPADPECARVFVEDFGARALRRPLTGDEVEHYLAQFDADAAEGDFYEGLRLALEAMLISPSFLYRSELGEPLGEGIYRLTPHETASLLSYSFWGTMPDAELRAAADDGSLETPEGIEAQARRLLDDPRGRDQVAEFTTQWLETTSVLFANKDAEVYPAFSDAVRTAMIEEERLFVQHVIFDSEQTVGELFSANYTFVNDTLAQFYGLPAPGSQDALVRVELPEGSERGGVLSLGSFLASHAHANETAPVRRGVAVRERVMCQPLAPPPPDIDATPPDLDPNATTRERYAQHSEDPTCAGCHSYIDPMGFGFEGFDGVGAYRTTENGLPVDESGSVVGLVDAEGNASTEDFVGVRELGTVLGDNAGVRRCVAQQYLHFTTGRGDLHGETCTLDALGQRMEESGGNMHELFIEVTQLPSFTLRIEEESP